MARSIGLNLELKDEDSADSSEEDIDDWGTMIARMMKNYPSMSLDNVLNLSYPQFKALYINIYNDKTFGIVIPFLGTGEEEKDKRPKIDKSKAKEINALEVSSIVAQMNRDFLQGMR